LQKPVEGIRWNIMTFVKTQDSCVQSVMSRRQFLYSSTLLAAAGTSAFLLSRNAAAQNAGRQAWMPPSNGSADPHPIPWLDRNGSHNQSPGPGMEPSSIYHFKGQVARCNDFTGMGTDSEGNRIAFGAPSTDFSLMKGEYFAARAPQLGVFSHI
jgi:hypothetical protein